VRQGFEGHLFPPAQALEVIASADSIEVKNAAVSTVFSKSKGSLTALKYRGVEVGASLC
jgi:hypothetical protein